MLVCVGASGLGLQKGFEFQSHQDDGLEMLDDSSQGDVFSDTPSSKVVGGDGKPKKKKTKTKSYVGLTSFDGGLVPGTSVKVMQGDMCVSESGSTFQCLSDCFHGMFKFVLEKGILKPKLKLLDVAFVVGFGRSRPGTSTRAGECTRCCWRYLFSIFLVELED